MKKVKCQYITEWHQTRLSSQECFLFKCGTETDEQVPPWASLGEKPFDLEEQTDGIKQARERGKSEIHMR